MSNKNYFQLIIEYDAEQVFKVIYITLEGHAITGQYQLMSDGTLKTGFGSEIHPDMEKFMRELLTMDRSAADSATAMINDYVHKSFGITSERITRLTSDGDDGHTLITHAWCDDVNAPAPTPDYESVVTNYIKKINDNTFIRVVRLQYQNVVFFIDATEPEANFRLIAMFNSRLNIRAGKEPINIALKDIPTETVNQIDELINTLCSNSFSRDYLNDNFEILTGEMVKKNVQPTRIMWELYL